MPSLLMCEMSSRTLSVDGAENDSSTVVMPSWGIRALMTSSPSNTMTVAMVAATNMPVPHARPMAAVTHRPAAVVSPRTTFFWKMMVPAPRNPMPDTTCAATRDESLRSTPKPYCDTTQNSALPSATRKCVRNPASFALYSRSMPIAPPSTRASVRRMVKSI